MPKNEAALQLQATNHHVVLLKNPPPLSETDEHHADFPAGAWLVVCEGCDYRWEATVGHAGLPIGPWFLCPNKMCNLSEKLALKLQADMKSGKRIFDQDLWQRCDDKLLSLRKPKRWKTWDKVGHLPAEPETGEPDPPHNPSEPAASPADEVSPAEALDLMELNGDAALLDHLADEVERRAGWHRRHDQWTKADEERFRDFD